jgi:hypothetical protein
LPLWLSTVGGVDAHGVPRDDLTESEIVITLIGLAFKLVKWTVITVAYLLVGLVKLVTIIAVLIFFTARAGIRRLLDAKERKDGEEPDDYDLGYPSHIGRSSERLTRDAFDARWQRERDLRVAGRRSDRPGEGDVRVYSTPLDERPVE